MNFKTGNCLTDEKFEDTALSYCPAFCSIMTSVIIKNRGIPNIHTSVTTGTVRKFTYQNNMEKENSENSVLLSSSAM
jgi:hypothetical protein